MLSRFSFTSPTGERGGERLPWQHKSIAITFNAHTVNLSLCKLVLGHVVQVAVVKESLKWTRVEREGTQAGEMTGSHNECSY